MYVLYTHHNTHNTHTFTHTCGMTGTYAYALSVMTTGYVGAVGLVVGLDDHVGGEESKRKEHFSSGHRTCATFTLLYFVALFVLRFREFGIETAYEMLWGCNVSMLQAAIGVLTSRRLLVSSAITTVLIDQLCWYVDVAGYAVCGRFPIKVAAYLLREHVSITKKITACHHLWFLPLYVWILRSSGTGEVSLKSWAMTAVLTSYLITFSRMFVPFDIHRPGLDDPVYLNVNLAHEFWDDVDIDFLHWLDGKSPFAYIPYAVVLCNVVLNGPPFLCLWWLMSKSDRRRHKRE